jgi:multiple sugar transport system permease protein
MPSKKANAAETQHRAVGRSVTPAARRSGRSGSRRNLWLGLAFASPFIVGFLVFFAYPIAASAYYSFTDFNLFQPPKWVGFDNYAQMFANPTFWQSLGNTMYLTIIGVPLSIVISLAGAHLLNFPVRGQPLYRALVYLPSIVPIVVGGYLWRWLLNAQYGFLNYLLSLIGVDGPAWLENPDWTKPAILLMSFWTVGGTMIIYLAALKDVPKDLYEAAELDGAGPWLKFLNVTWPVISPVTLFQIIVTMIAFLQIFTQPFILAQQRLNTPSAGPDGSMLTFAMSIYQNAFVFLKMGYASGMAWILFVLTLVITLIILATAKKWVHNGSN